MDGYVVSSIIAFSVAVGVLLNSLRRSPSQQVPAGPGAAVQDAPVAAVALDGNAVVRAWNRAAERMFGWSEREALNLPTRISSGSAEEREALVRALRGETVSAVKASRPAKDGRRVDIDLTVAPLM